LKASQVVKRIREWKLEDLLAVQQITWVTWLATYSSFIPLADLKTYFDEHYSLHALGVLFRDEQVDGLLGLVNDQIVGYEKNMFSVDEQRYYVSSLYILPQYQGLGLGKDLLDAAESKAVQRGLDRIWLGVMVENKSTLSWYQKHGFVFIEELPFTMGKTTVPHLIGYKVITKNQN
jgi:diamine N-acetyltransferase